MTVASWRWLDDLGRDMRHALRGLRRNAVFTATVVCVLAAGIGANTAMFGIVHGMLIRPLPYPDADAIVRVGEADRGEPQSGAGVLTNTTLPPLEAEAESFEQLAVYRTRSFDWDGPEGRTALSGAWVSPSLFPLLRARPRLGRLFTEADARAGGERVALLSHGAWTRRFGSSPDVVGTVMALDGAPHTVVGVRMALGAQARNILALVVRQGAALVAVGAVAGLLVAAAASRILDSFLFGVTALDRLTFVGAPLALVAAALVACWLPARRAARIDPMETLRAE